ncbi:Aspyridones efflux protein apdF, partial [Lachnellula arida]
PSTHPHILTSISPSSISWIGSIQAFLLLFISALTGPLFDAGYFRHLLGTGSFLIVFGMMMTSVASEYWQVVLAQAVCVGLGAGCLFVPGVSILPTYFSGRKAVATGVATSGSSLGGILYPIIFYKLEPRIGFGWATRVIAFIAFATLSISAAVMRVRVLPPAKRRLFLLSAWKDPPYTLFTLGLVCSFVGFYFPMFYIQSFAITKHITDASLGFYLLVILNAASLFGRIVPNLLADRYGPLNVIAPAAVIAAVLAFAWMGIRSTGGLVVFAVLYGFSSGCFVSIPPTVIVTLTKNMSEIGTRIGMNVAAAGFGVLIGNPIAGHLVQKNGFEAGMAFCAAIVAVGALLMVVARFAKTGYRVRVIA